jgi:hypothetical protein
MTLLADRADTPPTRSSPMATLAQVIAEFIKHSPETSDDLQTLTFYANEWGPDVLSIPHPTDCTLTDIVQASELPRC